MAEWKKVIVAGSNVSQLTNDSGYLTAQTATTAFKSASFNGVIIEASQSISGSVGVEGLQFNIETGSVSYDIAAAPSGSGLIISASATERKATFVLAGIPTASLQHTGSYIGKTKLGLGEVVGTSTATAISGAFFRDINASGSFTGSFVGDGSGLTNLSAGTRMATGSVTASVEPSGEIFKVTNNSAAPGDNKNFFVVDDKGNIQSGRRVWDNKIDASGSFILSYGSNYIGTSSKLDDDGGGVGFAENSFIGGGDSNKVHAANSFIWGASNVTDDVALSPVAFGIGLAVSGAASISASNDVRKVIIGHWNAPTTSSGDLFTIGNGTSNTQRSNLAVFNTASIRFNAPVTGSSFTGSFVGDGSGLTGLVTKLNLSGSNPAYGFLTGSIDLKTQSLQITGSGKEIEVTLVTGSNNTYFQVGLPGNVEISQSLQVGTDLTVRGNLFIEGTASYINTQDLFVEDRFIVLASGSTTANDAGIIIDRGAYVSGSVGFGYDADLNRWGWQANLNDTSSAMNIAGAGGNAVFASYLFTETNHGAADALLTGEFAQPGAFYVSGSEGSLYILV
jgi:hypothetical protein